MLATTAAEVVEHLAQPFELLAVAVLEPRLHHAAERRVQVAVVEQIVGDLLEDVVRVQFEAGLRAVPAGVPEPRSL